MAGDIFTSSQIVLEFMDKGMKGLLSGDLSSLAIKEIQKIIERGLPKMESIQKKIESHLANQDEQVDLNRFIGDRTAITGERQRNSMPVYAAKGHDGKEELVEQLREQLNVESHIVKKQIKVEDEVDFVYNSETMANQKKAAPRFVNHKNMEMYFNEGLDREQERIRSEAEQAQAEHDAQLRKFEE